MKSEDEVLANSLRAKIATIDSELAQYEETLQILRKLHETRNSLAHSLALIEPNEPPIGAAVANAPKPVSARVAARLAGKGPREVVIQTFRLHGAEKLTAGQVYTFAEQSGWKSASKNARLLLRMAMERLVESGDLEKSKENDKVVYRQTAVFPRVINGAGRFAPVSSRVSPGR